MEAVIQYKVTTKKGAVMLFGYNKAKNLVLIKAETNPTDQQYLYLVHNFPVTESLILEWRTKGFIVEKLITDISFKNFYSQFPKKANPKDATKAYKLLTDEQKLQAINGIKKLKQHMQNHPEWSCMYPATYIRGERYLDEY